MANEEHLAVLKKGVEAWNEWRRKNPKVKPDLTDTQISSTTLGGENFEKIDLSDANLRKSQIYRIMLNYSDLSRADLRGAGLHRVYLTGAHLSGAMFTNANLDRSIFDSANFTGANLNSTNLFSTDLRDAFFESADLTGADFEIAKIGRTTFGNVDLSSVRKLETVEHERGSIIDIRTIYHSKGNIPEVFLRGCGVPDDFIIYAHSLAGRAIEFYSCFISYSSKNKPFAERLYADLQTKGVRCWLASEDMGIGAKTRIAIDKSIRAHDKLLLILSKHSVLSDWVEQEVESALDRERKEKRAVLFPIRLDEMVMKIDEGWPALIKNTRNIGDFRKWKDHDAYQKAFDKLLRDLKAEA